MKPSSNYVMLQPAEDKEKKTASGIIYQLENQEDDAPTKKGIVLQLGSNVNKKMKRGNAIFEGDTLNYFPVNATEIIHEGSPVVVVHSRDIVTRD